MRCIFSESGGTISESSVSLRMLMAKPWLLGHSERRRARRLRSGRALKGCCRSTLAPAHYILPPVRWACEANLTNVPEVPEGDRTKQCNGKTHSIYR